MASGLVDPVGIAIDRRSGTIYFTELSVPALKAIDPPAPSRRHAAPH
ncbi:MAG TPA: hypothetical protein VNN08_25065 [Thermoanaerobaculia bacterium]|nr:hypothetical protein [Thermoanaerobaculia bacterium]